MDQNESLITDEILLEELSKRIERYKNALANTSSYNKQLLELNKKLSESEAMKSHFISNITNEIINPFASILGLAKSITECDDESPEKMKRMAAMIHREAFNLDFQFKNIFAAAEIEAGEIQPIVSVVNIDEMLNGLMQQYSREIAMRKLEAKLEKENDDGTVLLFKTDGDKLTVVLSNLICNAINFNRQGKQLIVRYGRTPENKLRISVIDEGLGISEENRKIIFDRFKRLDNGINSINRGHGLGLSINKAYIDLLEGQLLVESKENEGSTFTVILPESQVSSNDYSEEGNEVFFGDEEIF
ncbi:MAG: HAMP domain-containing histidine kinase [Bacteroidales bacterium]|nr:HAMP domain-containing histidine kinase [Bacteroidales bacterium]MBQ3619515.1 HAMP domain-containing histidine kinase [Bacteroidales bacterium]MBR2888372.1 HAMP domain-containing histidine kinase [Bacteroidales bacterium]MDD6003666.1 HAMP domain-containing sensor histidine kinase [Bacteroidales bacterium]